MNENCILVATNKIDIKSRAWLSGALGEAYVAFNLSLLGLRVAQTPRGAESVDLVAINPDTGKSATIQVKSSANRNGITIGKVDRKKRHEEIRADFIVVVPVQNGQIQKVAVIPKYGEDGIMESIKHIREEDGDKKGAGGRGKFLVSISQNSQGKLQWDLHGCVYWKTNMQKKKSKPHSLLVRDAWKHIYWEADTQKKRDEPHPLLVPYHAAWKRILEAVGK